MEEVNRKLTTVSALITMSSREISDLTSKRHDNVMADIRKMLVELFGEGGVLNFQDTYVNTQNGQSYPVFRLPKRETIILVSGYDIKMRARIVDRWQSLEEQAARSPSYVLPDFTNPAIAARAWADEVEQKQIAQVQVRALEVETEELRPKAEAHDRIADSFGSVPRRVAAKNLGIPPLTLNRWMRLNGWTYRHIGAQDDLAYQSKMAVGYLEHKVETGDRSDGTTWTRTSVRVTPKGMLALAKAFPPAASLANSGRS